MTSLVLTSTCLADSVIIKIDGARVEHDPRTGKPVLSIRISKGSNKAIKTVSADYLAHPIEFRLNRRTIFSPVIREPLTGGSLQISDNSFTEEALATLAEQLSASGEFELLTPSK